MKKLSAIFILSILLVNVAGFYVYYAVQLQKIKSAMRQALKTFPDDQLDVLKLTKEEYRATCVDENEVKVQGRMYDVARVNIKQDSVIIFALHDKKEDDLLAFVEEIVSKPLQADHPVPSSVIQFIGLHYIIPLHGCSFEGFSFRPILHFGYFFSIVDFKAPIDLPPPKA